MARKSEWEVPRIPHGTPPKNQNTKRPPFQAKGNGAREGNVFPTIKKFPMHAKKGLYCTWIRQTERPGAPLVAVWIDPAIGCFPAAETKRRNAEEVAVTGDDSGGVAEMPPPPAIVARQKWKKTIPVVIAMLLRVFAAMAAHGQTSGTVTGAVRDSSGAVIPGVSVEIRPRAS